MSIKIESLMDKQNDFLKNNRLCIKNTFIDHINQKDSLRKIKSYNDLNKNIDISSEYFLQIKKELYIYNDYINNLLHYVIMKDIKYNLIVVKIYETMLPKIILWKDAIIDDIKQTYSLNNQLNKQQQFIKLKIKQLDNNISSYILNISEKLNIFVKKYIKILKKCGKLVIPIDEKIKLSYKDNEILIQHKFNHIIYLSDYKIKK